ncbi:MAG: SDR family NAD(P)-dependent oxidoreductase [Candidatus Heimdallarchaeaceae archaeon]
MKIVITGSSRGIGFALAKKFAEYGDQIIISSRKQEAVDIAVNKIRSFNPDTEVYGTVCDVTKIEDVKALVKFSDEKISGIDIWINNAGINGSFYGKLTDWKNESIEHVIQTNLFGTFNGCTAAIEYMVKQGHGKVFNLAGMGSNGMASPNLAVYGATKASIPQLTKSLARELKDTNVIINYLSPGIVITDFITSNVPKEAVPIFNILAERPDKVAKYLVRKMRKFNKSNKNINFANSVKVFWKFMTASFRKNRFFDQEGNLIEK